MRMMAYLFTCLLVPASASAATHYSVQMELGLGGDAPLPIVMTVLENEPSILRLSSDSDRTAAQDELTVEVLVKGSLPTTKTGVDQAEVALTIIRETGGPAVRTRDEKMTVVVPLGTLSTMQLAHGDGAPGSDAIDVRLAVSKFEGKAGGDACIPQTGDVQANETVAGRVATTAAEGP